MSLWKVTHIDAAGQPHVLHTLAASAQAADDLAQHLYGPALCCACICLRRASPITESSQ